MLAWATATFTWQPVQAERRAISISTRPRVCRSSNDLVPEHQGATAAEHGPSDIFFTRVGPSCTQQCRSESSRGGSGGQDPLR